MKGIHRFSGFALAAFSLLILAGCASGPPPQPLTYVAVERPTGPIKCTGHMVQKEYRKDGMYFINFGFRPASDIAAYMSQAQNDAGSLVLKNADVECNVPFALDILMFGFQIGGADVVTSQ